MSRKLFPALTKCVSTLDLVYVTSCEDINRLLSAKLEGIPSWFRVKVSLSESRNPCGSSQVGSGQNREVWSLQQGPALVVSFAVFVFMFPCAKSPHPTELLALQSRNCQQKDHSDPVYHS